MAARPLFLLLYFLSGATALLYQVVWSRVLTLELGHTAAAVSTVLAAFMGGLAAGAAIGARIAPHVSATRALLTYTGLELLIGTMALGVAPALMLSRPVLSLAYQTEGGILFAALRVIMSLAAVSIPAAAMGATLPFAVRWVESRRVDSPGHIAGSLYAANTLGASLGACLTGFVLLPSLGLGRTTLLGFGINVLIALGAVIVSRTSHTTEAVAAPAPESAPAPRYRPPSGEAEPNASTQAFVAVAVSGFAALVHEVAWTRLIALVMGPTTYAFSAMLTAFILGLAIGGASATRLLGRLRQPLVALSVVQILCALGALLASALVPRLPFVIASVVRTSAMSYPTLVATEGLLVLALLLPMTFAFGATFPLAVHLAGSAIGSASRPVGRLFAVNTFGAIAGALAGGFFCLPRLGLQGTIVMASLLSLLVGVGLMWIGRRPLRLRLAVTLFGSATALVGLLLPAWNPRVLAAGGYRQAHDSPLDLRIESDAGSMLYYDDGPTGTVSVRRLAGEVSLAINGKVDASNAGDMLTQKLLAHLPLLLHEAPRDVCVIGLGSGVTAGAVLAHPIAALDTIELSPQVVRAAEFFASDNRQALRDRRVRLIVGDGRTHLRLARQSYDVIISEPSNPWVAGIAPLFTHELFLAARERLKPGGLFCQWAHTYEMSGANLRSIVATFTSVFPDSSLWLVGETDVLLVGATGRPLEQRLASLAVRWDHSGIADDLARVNVRDPQSLLSLFVAGGRALASFTTGADLQTDDRTSLEFSAPQSLYAPPTEALVASLRALARRETRPPSLTDADEAADAAGWRNRAAMHWSARAFGSAYESALRAITLSPLEAEAFDLLIKAAVPLRRTADTEQVLTKLIASHPDAAPPRIALSRLRASTGDAQGAMTAAEEAIQRFPGVPEGWEQLASVLADVGDVDRLGIVVRQLEGRFPDQWETAYYAASLHFLRGEFQTAARLGERAIQDREDARLLNLLGAAYASLGLRDRARHSFEASLTQDPRDPASYINLARFELETFNPRRAASLFAEALILDPRSPDARQGLADALVRMGEGGRASVLRAAAP
jgi:spermidine synthase